MLRYFNNILKMWDCKFLYKIVLNFYAIKYELRFLKGLLPPRPPCPPISLKFFQKETIFLKHRKLRDFFVL